MRLGIEPPDLNSFLNGRRGFSDERKMLIAEILNTTYVEMINLGQRLVDAERPPPFDKKRRSVSHAQIIKRFKDKATAAEINDMLADLEESDLDKYKLAKTYIQALHDALPKKKISNSH